jgi:sodium/proline symporter
MSVVSISFMFFLLIFLGVGVFSATRKQNTTEDYLVASRAVHPWFVALSAVATNNSGFMFIGLIGTTFTDGLSSMWIMFGWVVGDYIAWAMKIPDRLRVESEKNNAVTIPSFIAGNDGKGRKVAAVAGLITLVFLGIYSAAQLNAGSKALHSMFGWDYEVGAILGAIIVIIYCFAGGIRASIWTDVIQSIVMFISMLLLMIVGLNQIGGWNGLSTHLDAQLLSLWPSTPQFGLFMFIIGWVFAGFGVIGQPHVMVRAMSIDSVDHMGTARRVYVTWNAIFAIAAIAVGLIARACLPDLIEGFQLAEFDAELALPQMAQALLPDVVVGLCLAGLFAATMSTADSQILSCSAVLTEDLFPTKNQSYVRMKLATAFVTAIALGIALYAIALERSGQESGVFQLVVLAWAALAAGLGPVLVLRCFGYDLSENSSVLMMISGIGGVLIWRYGLQLNGAIYDVLPGMFCSIVVYIGWRLLFKTSTQSS